MKKLITFFTLITVLTVTAALPFMLIWCFNTLGIANAAYGITEWVAAFLLTTIFLSGSSNAFTESKSS